jgi:hypothetical protein
MAIIARHLQYLLYIGRNTVHFSNVCGRHGAGHIARRANKLDNDEYGKQREEYFLSHAIKLIG